LKNVVIDNNIYFMVNYKLIKVMFVCHGNICRSPMAEFILKEKIKKLHVEKRFYIESRATSNEETGNPVHYGTRDKLRSYGISTAGKYAQKLLKTDYPKFDYFIGMDEENIYNMKRLFSGDPDGKVYKLLGFAGINRDVADPWYTGNFDVTFDDIVFGIDAFLAMVL
jgi:Protein-tyrosine-phosphatase